MAAAAAVASFILAGAYSLHHTPAFAKAPTIPFDAVRELNLRIAKVTEALGPEAAVLTPDVGGALWEDRFRVIDLAGLTDRAFARTVGHDRRSIRDHVLNERRPEGVNPTSSELERRVPAMHFESVRSGRGRAAIHRRCLGLTS